MLYNLNYYLNIIIIIKFECILLNILKVLRDSSRAFLIATSTFRFFFFFFFHAACAPSCRVPKMRF